MQARRVHAVCLEGFGRSNSPSEMAWLTETLTELSNYAKR
jgi:hypothetical protein